MTKTRIGLGVFGIALAVACFAAGVMAELGAAGAAATQNLVGNTTGRGNFRLTVGPDGISCYQNPTQGATNLTTACPQRTLAGAAATFTSIAILETSNTCYMKVNNVTWEVPCR